MAEGIDSAVLERLYRVIARRRGGDPQTSYTASLFAGGHEAVAQKLGEEAVETVIAVASGVRRRLISERSEEHTSELQSQSKSRMPSSA